MNLLDQVSPIIDKWLASRIYARRRQIGLTQHELASALGMSQSALCKMEKGLICPIHPVSKLCEELVVDADKFFDRENDIYGLIAFLSAEKAERMAKKRLEKAKMKKARTLETRSKLN